jgi:alkane 1-monooxygenase
MFAYKPYQILETTEDTPTLPMGYTGSMTLAYCPPIWKMIMNPMVEAINRGELISAKVKAENKRITLIYLGVVWTVLTYITFGVVGFKK